MTENAEAGSREAREPDGHQVVCARGDLDWESAQDFAERIRCARGRRPALLIADLSGVTFADSSTLHTLFEAHRGLAAAGGRLVIAGPLDPVVQRLFDVSATAGYFHFAASAGEAVAGADVTKPRRGDRR
ncbi:STAS domain-containing protein [Kitasatospora sp. NPDC101176]|uniref:STAS domain-containing protein n=1 Tax=Kitasatospora sp. NPDC101176 TaxID=3364099 RepID=UPI0038029175